MSRSPADKVVRVQVGRWAYEVDTLRLVQTNVDLDSATQRQIRRRHGNANANQRP